MFARRNVALDFVRHHLPATVTEHLNLDTLRTVKASFVDDELHEHFSDILYQVQLQDETLAYVYLLFEHKSYVAPWVAFQLLRYMVRIWEHLLAQHQVRALPPIVPMVVYHGEQRWQVDPRFEKLVTLHPALIAYVPSFRYELCDLSAYSDTELASAVSAQVTLLLLKHIFDDDWRTVLPKVMALLQDLAQAESGLAYVEIALRYMAAAASALKREALEEAIEQTFPEKGGTLMNTIAQEWIAEGREQGLQQGMQQGMTQGLQQGMTQGLQQGMTQGAVQATRENIMELLDTRFSSISAEAATVIMAMEDLPRLKTLLKQAATANSLAEFEKLLKTGG